MREANEDGFRAFASDQAAALRRCAYLFCGDWHLAEDLMQTALIKIYRAWPTVRRQETLRNYTRKVLLNTWLDERRRPWRRSELRDGAVPEAADPTDAESTAVAKDLVHKALLELPPKQRAALVLRYFDELSVAETAVVLGCTEGTVKSQTARGLAAMRAVVSAMESDVAGSVTRRVAM